MKKWIYPLSLIFLFFILITVTVPEGAVFGSHPDLLTQLAALAETLRVACMEQHTLLPSWLELGSGSNGYQFSYYGFLRPDILIGCLLPQIPMIHILICYMLVVYLPLSCCAMSGCAAKISRLFFPSRDPFSL